MTSPAATATFDLYVANCKGGTNDDPAFPASIRAVKNHNRPLIGSLCEAEGKVQPGLKALAERGHGHFAAGGPKSTRGAQEVATLSLGANAVVHSTRDVVLTHNINYHWPKANQAADGRGQDRHARVTRYSIGDVKFTVVATHAPVMTMDAKGHWRTVPQSAEWRDIGLPALIALVEKERAQWGQVFVGGDMNTHWIKGSGLGKILTKHGYTFRQTGLMWAFWTEGPMNLVTFKILPQAPGTDHPEGELFLHFSTTTH